MRNGEKFMTVLIQMKRMNDFILYTSSKESCHLIGSTVSRGF